MDPCGNRQHGTQERNTKGLHTRTHSTHKHTHTHTHTHTRRALGQASACAHLDVEGLEHDLGGELPVHRRPTVSRPPCGIGHVRCSCRRAGREGVPVLRSVHRRLGQHEQVLLGLALQVLEDAVLPKPLDVVPILDLAVLDRRFNHPCLSELALLLRLVPDEEVKVLLRQDGEAD